MKGKPVISETQVEALKEQFGTDLLQKELMAKHSVMRVGGPADFLLTVHSEEELEKTVEFLWNLEIPFLLIGDGSNTLISDAGIREVVVINKAKEITFTAEDSAKPHVKAESGASFGNLARRTGSKGFSGLEWASSIPGTVGGAVVNNAGAFGSDVAQSLAMAEILHPEGKELQRSVWSVEDFAYDYRTSVIKSGERPAVVLNATFQLDKSTPEVVKALISEISEKRKKSQPQGASLGSMFKNPPGDYAGRLIEEAGLKGTQVGNAQISEVHANFFLNLGNATASDIAGLIALVKDQVSDKFGVELGLEIQFVGDWSNKN